MTLDEIVTQLRSKKWVDLTHSVTESIPIFSAFPGVQRNTLYTVEQDGFFAQQLTFVTQTGTHIDAPAHFAAGKRCLDCLANKELLLPLRVIHRQEAVAQDADYRLSVQDGQMCRLLLTTMSKVTAIHRVGPSRHCVFCLNSVR